MFDNNIITAGDLTLRADDKTFTIETSTGTDKFTVASSTGNTTIAGTLDVTGTSNFGKVTIGDAKYTDGVISDNYLEVGTSGNGLRIWTNKNGYEGGGNDDTYISEIGNGSLAIATNGSNLYLQKNTSGTTEAFINCIADGAVRIFYDQSVHDDPKFATTATGVSITGQVDLTTDINVNTNKFNVAGATGNTTIAGTLTTAAQKAVTLGGPLILSQTDTQLPDANTFAVTHTWHELESKSGDTSDTIDGATGGTKGQILLLSAKAGHIITVNNGGDANDFNNQGSANLALNGTERDHIQYIHDGTLWNQTAPWVEN
jgi:hypothetical protein